MSFAIAIASASVAKRLMPATGPNVSSQLIAISIVTPVSTDGWKNWPSMRLPPSCSSAPWASASATWRSTFAIAGSSISGPTCTPSVNPSATFSAAAASVKAPTKSS